MSPNTRHIDELASLVEREERRMSYEDRAREFLTSIGVRYDDEHDVLALAALLAEVAEKEYANAALLAHRQGQRDGWRRGCEACAAKADAYIPYVAEADNIGVECRRLAANYPEEEESDPGDLIPSGTRGVDKYGGEW